jgi:hypothetical protein
MTGSMRSLVWLVLVSMVGCATDDRTPLDDGSQTFRFGPLTIPADTEDLGQCVALTLHNTEELYINEVELTTGPGFHHSNWLWVPDHLLPGPDGIFPCKDRNYDQTAAGIVGGVFFAQSTQSPHEVQHFPDGVALKLPVGAKLVAQIHLLNTGDEAIPLDPTISFRTVPKSHVINKLASVTFEYHPLALPPQKRSRFTVECDLAPRHLEVFGTMPSFNIYYALAHYHEWGTGMTLEAVKSDGTAATIYSTAANVGDTLGGSISPAFSMSGYSKLRLRCDYYNDTAQTIYYGNGTGEMCIFNAFSDSPYNWAGGALDSGDPGQPTNVDGVMSFTRGCQVFAVESEKF